MHWPSPAKVPSWEGEGGSVGTTAFVAASSLGSWYAGFKDSIRCSGTRGAGVPRSQTWQTD